MFAMKSFSCMPAVQTPEAPRDTRHLRIPGSRLPPGVIGSATPTDFDFGANTPFTFVPACKPPCLRFAVTVTGHHARLGTRLLAKLYRGGHPRPPNFMRFPRRNTPESGLSGWRCRWSVPDPKETWHWRPRSSLGGDSIQAYSGGKVYSGGKIYSGGNSD